MKEPSRRNFVSAFFCYFFRSRLVSPFVKNLLIALIFFGSAATLVYFLYLRIVDSDLVSEAKQTDEEATPVEEVFIFPDDVEIVRKDGSRMDVRLIGRNATHIQFERLSDQMGFTFEIRDLDTPTQRRIRKYPEEGFVEPEKPEIKEPETAESLHVAQLREEIAKIDAELRDLEVKFTSASSNAKKRTFANETQKLKATRLKLSAEVAKRTGEKLEQ